MRVRRALVSVHEKTGVVEFARSLAALGIEILSTGGTATLLGNSGVPVRDVSDVTGFPEMLDGRVKTLHPKIHGGILARRDAAAHMEALEKHGILPIDLVVVALYPFEATVARSSVTLAEALERIDVGGPAMVRAAAKNHASVGVVTDPSQYPRVLDELRANGGALSEATRARLAQEAFRRTAQYDAAIATYLSKGASAAPSEPSPRTGCAGGAGARTEEFPSRLELNFERALGLRYGENPHQAAAFYTPLDGPRLGLAAMTSSSRSEPPGWITAVAPAFATTSRPSRNGKKASEAHTVPAVSRPTSRARITAKRAESTRFIWPAPTPTTWPRVASTIAFDLACLATRQAKRSASISAAVG